MKTPLDITRDQKPQPNRGKEVDAFTHFMATPNGPAILEDFGLNLPPTFVLYHHSQHDDPPDMMVLGRALEHTDFPPNQRPRQVAFGKHDGPMPIPPLQLGKSPKQILDYAHDADLGDEETGEYSDHITGGFHPVADEVEAMEQAFLETLDRKDIPGADILLLDGRADFTSAPIVTGGILRAMAKRPPRHVRYIVLVRTNSYQIYPKFDSAANASRP